MKTRFSSIVKYKHSKVKEDEVALQKQRKRLEDAKEALRKSIAELENLQAPKDGNMQQFLASRSLLDAQFRLIEKNKEWVAYETKQLQASQEQLKQSTIEYEKFKYLETEEIKKLKKELTLKESKRLDEVAIMTYGKRERVG